MTIEIRINWDLQSIGRVFSQIATAQSELTGTPGYLKSTIMNGMSFVDNWAFV
ncbi:hypothetical protein HanXRQr2_Chr10g0426551 [Helianthus annuus]|uniref:Uncharacterized protein n=1 Tax=Helianthus annuus TaxID=4232 RepID=A0A9K3HVK7_HELAN|nr:hypothetical protein HanXRQr2_Chr10g0426551 [Helianthus annuus]KAJ0512841.1 hypothetical protein HanHA300_Chr10g0350691 [Helianthus annuus]KAJ0520534.1 hypothetical protein HanIR_Chr10g0460471 [Helianthus annuus]KAJ0528965.1 hypothetical protein HanHA89_Chr10g0372391 [Helianthus annuus]KAJ0695881.1 hypothetical protein HanLR1_Chr10g0350611 [Helianthus annuus]